MSKIIDFFDGVGTDGAGRTLEEIMGQRLDWMESCHDYIQWLFPLQEPSNFNPEAPLLTEEDIQLMAASCFADDDRWYHFMCGVSKFLYFLGIKDEWTFGQDDKQDFSHFELADNFETQRDTWLTFNHNALRITRMLACISLWYPDFARELLEFMKQTAEDQRVILSNNTLRYWEDALKGRDRIYK